MLFGKYLGFGGVDGCVQAVDGLVKCCGIIGADTVGKFNDFLNFKSRAIQRFLRIKGSRLVRNRRVKDVMEFFSHVKMIHR